MFRLNEYGREALGAFLTESIRIEDAYRSNNIIWLRDWFRWLRGWLKSMTDRLVWDEARITQMEEQTVATANTADIQMGVTQNFSTASSSWDSFSQVMSYSTAPQSAVMSAAVIYATDIKPSKMPFTGETFYASNATFRANNGLMTWNDLANPNGTLDSNNPIYLLDSDQENTINWENSFSNWATSEIENAITRSKGVIKYHYNLQQGAFTPDAGLGWQNRTDPLMANTWTLGVDVTYLTGSPSTTHATGFGEFYITGLAPVGSTTAGGSRATLTGWVNGLKDPVSTDNINYLHFNNAVIASNSLLSPRSFDNGNELTNPSQWFQIDTFLTATRVTASTAGINFRLAVQSLEGVLNNNQTPPQVPVETDFKTGVVGTVPNMSVPYVIASAIVCPFRFAV